MLADRLQGIAGQRRRDDLLEPCAFADRDRVAKSLDGHAGCNVELKLAAEIQ
jgi:hypothetical protein